MPAGHVAAAGEQAIALAPATVRRTAPWWPAADGRCNERRTDELARIWAPAAARDIVQVQPDGRWASLACTGQSCCAPEGRDPADDALLGWQLGCWQGRPDEARRTDRARLRSLVAPTVPAFAAKVPPGSLEMVLASGPPVLLDCWCLADRHPCLIGSMRPGPMPATDGRRPWTFRSARAPGS